MYEVKSSTNFVEASTKLQTGEVNKNIKSKY